MPRNKSMRERVSVQVQAKRKDNYGHERVIAWDAHAELQNLPASWEHTGGTETFRGRQIEAGVSGVFELRKPHRDINPDMRLVHENDDRKEYEIHSVRPAEGKYEGGFRYIWVFVKALANV